MAAQAETPAPAKEPAAPKGTPAKATEPETKPVAPAKEEAATKEKAKKKAAAPKAPRRPTLDPERARLVGVRAELDRARPKFVRTASHRYWRIGRWGSWRRPRGLQSKQRRHYGYRPVVVSVGFRSPRRVRGLTPTGFRPVVVHTSEEVRSLERTTEAAVIARTVGTRRRLVLEETARKLGIHVLNPIASEEKEE